MADPVEGIPGVQLQRITEGILSVDEDPVQNLDTANCEKIELTNKGTNTVYFRCDGTTPTAQAAGNADQLASGANRVIERGLITDIKFICHTGESATIFFRLYS
jgi:hypothetical protein